MINRLKKAMTLFFTLGLLILSETSVADSQCKGRFVNPLTDICWSCLFPLSIGSATIVSGRGRPDTKNPSFPLQICPMKVGFRIGLAIGYWEPFAITDVTRSPYCLVNLGGLQPNIGIGNIRGASESPQSGTQGAFYQVHWYKYPLIAWLNILTSLACFQGGDYDIGYLSELDPMWSDDELSFVLNPEAVLFSNPIAQAACLGDALAAAKGSAINRLFWCMGAQGPSYPLTGHLSAEYSVLENAVLASERMAYKLHREGIVKDSNSENFKVCHQSYHPILPKDRYRYELVNLVSDAHACHPFGRTTTVWQMGKIKPNDKGNYGFLIWRKRNCVFL